MGWYTIDCRGDGGTAADDCGDVDGVSFDNVNGDARSGYVSVVAVVVTMMIPLLHNVAMVVVMMMVVMATGVVLLLVKIK